MNYKTKLTIIFFIIIFSFNIYISGFLSLFKIIFAIFFYSLFFYIFYGLYKKIRVKEYIFFDFKNFSLYFNEFLYKISILIIFLGLIIGGFSYYQNEINPAKMPIFTLSNGDKTVVFQTMSHIGTPSFYENVKQNIIKFKKKGFVLYFEGVKPGSKENYENFNKALGIKFDQTTYSNMSKLYGLVNQDNDMFLGLVNNLDFNVDISIDDIMHEYNMLKINAGIKNRTYKEPIDVGQLIINELSKLKDKELNLLIYINRAFINLIIKSEKIQKTIQDNFSNKELFEVILNKRNEVLAKEIISSDHKNIIVIYGLLHFDGVFKILKQHDIKWQIKNIDYLYPIK